MFFYVKSADQHEILYVATMMTDMHLTFVCKANEQLFFSSVFVNIDGSEIETWCYIHLFVILCQVFRIILYPDTRFLPDMELTNKFWDRYHSHNQSFYFNNV